MTAAGIFFISDGKFNSTLLGIPFFAMGKCGFVHREDGDCVWDYCNCCVTPQEGGVIVFTADIGVSPCATIGFIITEGESVILRIEMEDNLRPTILCHNEKSLNVCLKSP